MILPARWFVEPVTIESYTGQSAYGDQFAAAVTVLGHITGGQRVQSSSTADVVVSAQRVMLPNPARLADGSGTVDPTELLTPESRVTSGSVVGKAGSVVQHRQPGTGAVVYVSGEIV